jgi:hypothetical protein
VLSPVGAGTVLAASPARIWDNTRVPDLPPPARLRDLLADLLGRDVTVVAADPLPGADPSELVVTRYVDEQATLAAVVGMDLPLAIHAGAALGLIPPAGAHVAAEERELTPVIAENVAEVAELLGTLFNAEGQPHVRMDEMFLPGRPVPADVRDALRAPGGRLDLTVDVAGYGSGRLAVVLPA